jgi:hypothetical protein
VPAGTPFLLDEENTMASSVNLTVHHLRFTLEARTVVHLGLQAGAQLRGALWDALSQFACQAPSLRGDPEHTRHCPMCRLVALETGDSPRGKNPPRPFAVQPPLAARPEQERYFRSGEQWSVGISLFGDLADVFPYLCQAMYRVGEKGIGYGRGQFNVVRLQAVNPLTRQTQDLLEGQHVRALPNLPVTAEVIAAAAQSLSPRQAHLRFLTPTEIVEDHQFLSAPTFSSLIARLLERCQALELHYAADPTPQPIWRERYLRLTDAARQVGMMRVETRWIKVRSGSRRTGVSTPIGGFVGDVLYEGNLTPFHEWLLWGQSLQVGKNTVKGCGWYEILPSMKPHP